MVSHENHMKQFPLILALVASPVAAGEITLVGPNSLDWQVTPEGVAFASLEGDRFAEAYRAMVRLPSGTTSPPHIKSAAMFGVMLQGRMRHYPADADPDAAPEIGAGGFYKIPGGLAHVSACVSAEPCVTYLYQDAAFVFLPVAK